MTKRNTIILPRFTEKDKQRFEKRIRYFWPRECWLWRGALDKEGYGKFSHRDSSLVATRVAYYLAYNVDPGSLLVCHKCDNPRCVNPCHLFLGTNEDNMADMRAKGRARYSKASSPSRGNRNSGHVGPKGENSGKAKLSNDKVIEIRAIYQAGGISTRRLGQLYNVSHRCIGLIVARKRWDHV